MLFILKILQWRHLCYSGNKRTPTFGFSEVNSETWCKRLSSKKTKRRIERGGNVGGRNRRCCWNSSRTENYVNEKRSIVRSQSSSFIKSKKSPISTSKEYILVMEIRIRYDPTRWIMPSPTYNWKVDRRILGALRKKRQNRSLDLFVSDSFPEIVTFFSHCSRIFRNTRFSECWNVWWRLPSAARSIKTILWRVSRLLQVDLTSAGKYQIEWICNPFRCTMQFVKQLMRKFRYLSSRRAILFQKTSPIKMILCICCVRMLRRWQCTDWWFFCKLKVTSSLHTENDWGDARKS